MKKNHVIAILLFVSLVFSFESQAQTIEKYENQWKQVEKYRYESLLKSALEEVDKILHQAIAEKNTPQTIKSLIHKGKFKEMIDGNDNIYLFAELNELLKATNKDVDKSLLHSMLGEMYLNYYSYNKRFIDKRTNLNDFVPEDMQEWTKNIFFDKAIKHFDESVKNKEALLNASTKSYADIILLGEDSEKYYPTLYDFVANRAIDQSKALLTSDLSLTLKKSGIASVADFADNSRFLTCTFNNNELHTFLYQQEYFKSLTKRHLTKTWILTELNRLSYIASKSDSFSKNEYLKALEKLQKQYENDPISVEVIEKIVNLDNMKTYSSRYSSANSTTTNQIKAYELCEATINKFPDYERINILKSIKASMDAPSASLNGNDIYHPNQTQKVLSLQYKNLKKITLNIREQGTSGKYELVKTMSIDLSNKKSYLTQTKDIILDLNELGEYDIDILFDKKTREDTPFCLQISKLAVLAKANGKNKYTFYALDRLTGKPIEGASIIIKKGKNLSETLKTDKMGFADYTATEDLSNDYSLNRRYTYQIATKEEKQGIQNDLPYQYYYKQAEKTEQKSVDQINIFTDRSIYRPGQTVYFKSIAFEKGKNASKPISNKEYTAKLYDQNNQLISEQKKRSNEFGSISGEFVLPKGSITGSFRVGVDNVSEYINVEEYKRPTFQVTFDKIEKTYTFGDKVSITGHAEAFSGVKLQDAAVDYTVTKSNWLRWMGGNAEPIENNSVTSKSDGSFVIEFTIPENDSKNIPYWCNIQTFSINAEVTDVNGETQSGNFSFAVGSISMSLSLDIAEILDKDANNKIEIKASNLNGEKITTSGNYTLYSMSDNDSIVKAVLDGRFSTESETDIAQQLKKPPSGKYKIKLQAKDSNDQDVEAEKSFVLYSLKDKQPPFTTNDWLIEKNVIFSKEKNAEIILGVSEKNAIVLYELVKDGKTISREQVKFSNENKSFVIPYKDEYGSRIYACFTYIINEQVYNQNIALDKEQIYKTLNLKFDVFRDKLRPGQAEEWRISVKDDKNSPVVAEVLASMYDASLDKIRNSRVWNVNNYFEDYSSYPTAFSSGNYFDKTSKSFNFENGKAIIYPNLSFDQLNWFRHNRLDMRLFTGAGAVLTGRVAGVSVINNSGSFGAAPKMRIRGGGGPYGKMAESNVVDTAAPTALDTQSAPAPQAQIRKNFNETAFFFPHLKTNERGETVVSFTVPESNTTWKFRALAYDKSINVGSLEAIAVSRKELMVTPNLPRFMRHGDKTSISTKISNLSDGAISGTVRIEFFDPLTEEIKQISTTNASQLFTIAQDESTSVEWTFDVPTDIEMIGCRIIAESETFSDGEQHVISILPNKMLVTETMPMNVIGIQSKKFRFENLINNKSNTLSNYRLTLEYSSNPAWYAVQALPTLSNPTNENAVNWFASYYVNTLGSFITKQNPKVTNMIKAWKQQGGTKETLASKLTENEELKSVLLEETPWVLEAKSESEQMNRLALLFDLNKTQEQTNAATNKLKELQNSDGGWSWYKGFISNRSMTQYILYGYSELINLNAVEYPNDVREMQINAIKYIDKQIREDFENLKKYNKKWKDSNAISTNQLEYLFVRANYRDIPIDAKSIEAERFYTSVVEKNWTKLNLYESSLLAIVAKQNGNKELSNKIMKSIREHSTTNEEMGMFWANNRSSAFLSQSAVTKHVFIMDAFKETGASAKEMNQMKQWLLKQKQTQLWESTHATMDAIYALLKTGSDWFSNTKDVNITVDNKTIEPENKEAGTGYFKQSWSKNEIANNMGHVTVSKVDDGPSYGAIYWQYYEDLNKISAQKGELNVDKKLFVESSTDNGKTLSQITEEKHLKVGDKVVVRLTVRVDRDMEFVHLKDMRAACFEPIETNSGTKWKERTSYYQSTKDASTNFYFDYLGKGTYVFEYPVYVNRTGEYANGITTIQCLYAPEFTSHTAGINVIVK